MADKPRNQPTEDEEEQGAADSKDEIGDDILLDPVARHRRPTSMTRTSPDDPRSPAEEKRAKEQQLASLLDTVLNEGLLLAKSDRPSTSLSSPTSPPLTLGESIGQRTSFQQQPARDTRKIMPTTSSTSFPNVFDNAYRSSSATFFSQEPQPLQRDLGGGRKRSTRSGKPKDDDEGERAASGTIYSTVGPQDVSTMINLLTDSFKYHLEHSFQKRFALEAEMAKITEERNAQRAVFRFKMDRLQAQHDELVEELSLVKKKLARRDAEVTSIMSQMNAESSRLLKGKDEEIEGIIRHAQTRIDFLSGENEELKARFIEMEGREERSGGQRPGIISRLQQKKSSESTSGIFDVPSIATTSPRYRPIVEQRPRRGQLAPELDESAAYLEHARAWQSATSHDEDEPSRSIESQKEDEGE